MTSTLAEMWDLVPIMPSPEMHLHTVHFPDNIALALTQVQRSADPIYARLSVQDGISDFSLMQELHPATTTGLYPAKLTDWMIEHGNEILVVPGLGIRIGAVTIDAIVSPARKAATKRKAKRNKP